MVKLRSAWAAVELLVVWDFLLVAVTVFSRLWGSNSSHPLPSFWSFLSVGSSRGLSAPSDFSASLFTAVVVVFGTAEKEKEFVNLEL